MRVAMLAAADGEGPDPTSDRPELAGDLSHVWQGFWQLSAGRALGETGPQPLRTEAIEAWLSIHGHEDLQERQELLDWLLTMDLEYLRWSRARASDAYPVP